MKHDGSRAAHDGQDVAAHTVGLGRGAAAPPNSSLKTDLFEGLPPDLAALVRLLMERADVAFEAALALGTRDLFTRAELEALLRPTSGPPTSEILFRAAVAIARLAHRVELAHAETDRLNAVLAEAAWERRPGGEP